MKAAQDVTGDRSFDQSYQRRPQMSSQQAGAGLRAWQRWKSLRLPWRRRFLIGSDLHGNTFWEFRDRGAAPTQRWRRIVEYAQSTHYGDVKVSPAWHQWLRHTRAEPPTIEEQHVDVLRQQQLKVLAAEADARWEAKPRVSDIPAPPVRSALGPAARAAEPATAPEGATAREEEREKKNDASEPVIDPWKRARSGPSEGWQPQSWSPADTPKR